jgi:hypothetical protein
MSYAIGRGPNGDFQVILTGEPPICEPLPQAPGVIEPDLKHCAWLVLLVAVWSGPDRDAIRTALRVGKEVGDTIRVGLRPFDSHDEIRAWYPEVREQYRSPVWLTLKEGALLEERFGTLPQKEVREMVDRMARD